ncbi:MAG: hypothetical protein ACE148_16260 [Vicinamibacterales bacterium]
MRESGSGPLANAMILIPLAVLVAVAAVLAGGPRDLLYIVQETSVRAAVGVRDWIATLF